MTKYTKATEASLQEMIESVINAGINDVHSTPLTSLIYSTTLGSQLDKAFALGYSDESAREILREHRNLAWVVAGFEKAGVTL